jgi:hypothetical protein
MSDSGREALSKALKALQDNPENPEAAIKGFEDEATELRVRADALDQIANGIRGLIGADAPMKAPTPLRPSPAPIFPQPSPTPPSGVPEGMDAVRLIMAEGGTWTVASLFEEMQKRGWDSKESKEPSRAAEAALNRLWKVKKEVERVGRGQYRYIDGQMPYGSRNGLFDGAGT